VIKPSTILLRAAEQVDLGYKGCCDAIHDVCVAVDTDSIFFTPLEEHIAENIFYEVYQPVDRKRRHYWWGPTHYVDPKNRHERVLAFLFCRAMLLSEERDEAKKKLTKKRK